MINEIYLHSNLSYLVKENGITQDEFAKKMFFSREAVAKYVNGKRVPSLERIISMAEYFSVSLDALVLHRINEEDYRKKRAEMKGDTKQMNSTETEVFINRADYEMEFGSKEKAIYLLEILADDGNVDAMLKMYNYYSDIIGEDEDEEKKNVLMENLFKKYNYYKAVYPRFATVLSQQSMIEEYVNGEKFAEQDMINKLEYINDCINEKTSEYDMLLDYADEAADEFDLMEAINLSSLAAAHEVEGAVQKMACYYNDYIYYCCNEEQEEDIKAEMQAKVAGYLELWNLKNV